MKRNLRSWVLLLAGIAALAAVPARTVAQAPTFNTIIATPTGSAPWQPPRPAAVGDFNGDGKLDAFIVDGSPSARFMYGNGNGTFQKFDINADQMTTGNMVNLPGSLVQYMPKAIDGYMLVKSADVNGDGKLDAVCVTTVHINYGPYSLVTVLINTGNDVNGVPQFSTTNYYLGFYDVRSLTVGDLNGDGKPDIIVGSAYAGLYIYQNNGDGTFTPGQVTSIMPNAGGPAVGQGVIVDVNGDGKADFVVTSGQANATDLFIGNGDGTLQAPIILSPAASCIAVADLNKDGKPDLIEGLSDGSVSVYLGNGNGTFGSPANFPSGAANWPTGFFVADVNGDGNLDVAASLNAAGKVAILTGNGDGTLSAPSLFGTIPNAVDVTLADFTGDGKPDIASVSPNGYGGQNFDLLTNTTPFGPPPAIPPVIFTRTTATAEGWKKYTVNFIPTHSGNYTLGFNLIAGGPSGDNAILIDAVKITNGATTAFSDGFETPVLGTNAGVSANGGAAVFGNWAFNNYSGILNGSPANWGLDAQGLGSADGTYQYAYLQAVFGTLGKIKATSTLPLVAGQTYTLTFFQASRLYFGGQVTNTVTIDDAVSAPVVTSESKSGSCGSAFSYQIVATNSPTAYAAAGLPAGLAVNASTGAISGTLPNIVGTFPIDLTASNAGGPGKGTLTLKIVDLTPPVLTVPPDTTVIANAAGGYSGSLGAATAVDNCVGPVSITSDAPTIYPLGVTTIHYTARDSSGNVSTGTQKVTVKPYPIIVDIKPGSSTNVVNFEDNGVIPVAVLSTPTFDATKLDVASLRFGPGGAHPVLDKADHKDVNHDDKADYKDVNHDDKADYKDVNHDGRADLMLQFVTKATGLTKHDHSATLIGTTKTGIPVEGSDFLNVGRLGKEAAATEVGPTTFSLEQNYPNPFNPTTSISFTVPSTGFARMVVVNSLGQQVATLFDGIANEGMRYNVTFDALGLSSGVYTYQLSHDGRSFARRMLLLK
ncbi:MAG: FG-GAP-like repeat-containing protein [Ignavibacteriales bacterium]|nr:FG-GAP-like repeat-containing protein [Ignavibacteriales bacterium]